MITIIRIKTKSVSKDFSAWFVAINCILSSLTPGQLILVFLIQIDFFGRKAANQNVQNITSFAETAVHQVPEELRASLRGSIVSAHEERISSLRIA